MKGLLTSSLKPAPGMRTRNEMEGQAASPCGSYLLASVLLIRVTTLSHWRFSAAG